MDMTEIGRCAGCAVSGKLDDGACPACHARGPKWVKTAKLIRTDPEFARRFFEAIPSTRHKQLFAMHFGLPEGCIDPDAPKLRLVAG